MTDTALPFGIIFDIDGTLVKNMSYHEQAWEKLAAARGFEWAHLREHIWGKENKEIYQTILGRDVSDEEGSALTDEKEATYRAIYAPHIKPFDGLIDFMEEMKAHNIPMATGSNAPTQNIEFVMSHIPFQPFLSTMCDPSHVEKAKPAPDMFLLAAEKIGRKPEDCLVFEDSLAGLAAAKAAGMRAVALAGTHDYADLAPHCVEILEDYTPCSRSWIEAIFQK